MQLVKIFKIYISNLFFNSWFLLAYFKLIFDLISTEQNTIYIIISVIPILLSLHYINLYRYYQRIEKNAEKFLAQNKMEQLKKQYFVSIFCIFAVLISYFFIT